MTQNVKFVSVREENTVGKVCSWFIPFAKSIALQPMDNVSSYHILVIRTEFRVVI